MLISLAVAKSLTWGAQITQINPAQNSRPNQFK